MNIELGDIIYYKKNKNAYYVGAITDGSYSLIYNGKVYTLNCSSVVNDIKNGEAVLYKKVA